MEKKLLFSNLMTAMLAQGVSLMLSFLTSFILPRFLDVENFSFWQLFTFYVTYVGVFHFGINDGVYLKYGGTVFEDMDRELVSGQFKCLFLIQVVIVGFLGYIAFVVNIESERKFVLIFTLLYMLVFNLTNYLSYIFQAANLTKLYSYSVILDKVFFMLAIVFLFLSGNKVFQPYVVFYLGGKIASLIYCLYKGKSVIFCRISSRERVICELEDSMKIGIKLTLSSMSSMMILGVGRFMIDSHWGVVVFGKVSFALSLTTFVLAFVQQIGMVFFPALRRVGEATQIQVYQTMRRFCFFIMPFIYLLMLPGKWVIAIWLPQYTDSLYYLGILLPICVFDSKMNMIFNTYFKVLRKEKTLLQVNMFSLALSCVLSVIGTYIMESYWFVIVGMVISVVFRSLYSELNINQFIGIRATWKPIFEIAFAVIYMLISYFNVGYLQTFLVLVIIYLAGIIIYKKEFVEFCLQAKHILTNGSN